MSELKPCPFCGHDEPNEDFDHDEHPYIQCPECYAATAMSSFEHVRIRNWNNRPREDALQARIDELEINLEVTCKDFQELREALENILEHAKDNVDWRSGRAQALREIAFKAQAALAKARGEWYD